MLFRSVVGNNTITGVLDNIFLTNKCNHFVIKGNSTITGPVSQFVQRFITTTSTLSNFIILPQTGGLTSAEVDNILNNFTYLNSNLYSTINLAGINQPRTSASDNAISFYQTRNVIIVVNT